MLHARLPGAQPRARRAERPAVTLPDPDGVGVGPFGDPALERDFLAWSAAERGRVYRGGFFVLLAGVMAFAPMDRLVAPAVAPSLLLVRLVTFAALAVAVPAFFGRRSTKVLAARGQAWLTYVAGVSVVGLAVVAWQAAPHLTVDHRYVALLAFCMLLSALYAVTGLHARRAGAIGVSATLAWLLAAWVHAPDALALHFAALLFGGGTNTLGWMVCRELERASRRAFLRERALADEHARADRLLLNLMPQRYADRLARGDTAAVDHLPHAAVLFATVTGFSEATRARGPLEGVALLDRIVARFDTLALQLDVERIKTVGATYMAAGGVGDDTTEPERAVVTLAVRMREAVHAISAEEGVALSLRVGVAAGPLVVGVIGRTRYAFDCWGDTVNTAARLEAAGAPGQIQTDAAVAGAVSDLGARPRGPVLLKGKGLVESWWVASP